MTAPRHTPGPWGCWSAEKGDSVVKFERLIVTGPGLMDWTVEERAVPMSVAANAPDLLAALAAILPMLESCGYGGKNEAVCRRHERIARAAIAKATGSAS